MASPNACCQWSSSLWVQVSQYCSSRAGDHEEVWHHCQQPMWSGAWKISEYFWAAREPTSAVCSVLYKFIYRFVVLYKYILYRTHIIYKTFLKMASQQKTKRDNFQQAIRRQPVYTMSPTDIICISMRTNADVVAVITRIRWRLCVITFE